MRRDNLSRLAPGAARGLGLRRAWLVGFAMLVWARTVVGPSILDLRAASIRGAERRRGAGFCEASGTSSRSAGAQ